MTSHVPQPESAVYEGPVDIRHIVQLTPALDVLLEEEFRRDPARYTPWYRLPNGTAKRNKPSRAEVMRRALHVYVQLRHADPALFFLLQNNHPLG